VRTFAVINQKGGCGKTTTSINLAAAFAELGRRVLLVDVDPQAHCALGLAVPESQITRHIGDAMLAAGGAARLDAEGLVWQISANLDLIPSTVGLAAVESRLADAPERDLRLARILARFERRYDLCIIDCPPAVGLLTFNALRAAHEVIIPVETGYFALKGARKQATTLQILADRCGHQPAMHVLPTMYDVRQKMGREILAELDRHFGDAVLPVPIHYNSKLKEAAGFGQPVLEYDAASRGAQDFARLARHLLDHKPAAAAPTARNLQSAPEALEVAGFAPAPPRRLPREMGLNDQAVDALHERLQSLRERTGPAPDPDAQEPVDEPPRAPLSRAAELVQRAKALAARTNRLHARVADDENRAASTPPADRTRQPDPDPGDGNGNGNRNAAPARSLDEKLAALYGVRHTRQGTLFVQPPSDARRVAIAGDFNDWTPSATPLQYNAQLGVWEGCVQLQPGRYRYRLVVDGKWITDPHNTYVEANPFGELNNIVEVE